MQELRSYRRDAFRGRERSYFRRWRDERRADDSFSAAFSSFDKSPPPPNSPPPPEPRPPLSRSSSSGPGGRRRPVRGPGGGGSVFAPARTLVKNFRSPMPHRLDAMKYTHRPAGTL